MNCKPDQLCRVLTGENAHAVVRTKHRCGCLSDTFLSAGGDGIWTCEALQHMKVGVETANPGTEVCCTDSNLKPLGEEGPEDMTISDELKKFAEKETKKIIPIVWHPEKEMV